MRRALVVLALLLCVLPAWGKIVAVDTVSIPVDDLERSVAFYRDVLDFESAAAVEVTGEDWARAFGLFGTRARVARLRLGEQSLELVQFLAPGGRRYPEDARSNDRSFQHVAIIVSDMAAAYRRLREHGVRHASSGPQKLPDWNEAAGGIEAFYFKDPDGHPLEILRFPEGKGAPAWHRSDRLFLGIDHTAIVIGSTEASLAFYGGGLGMAKVGESENYGTEQEHLNNVFGARLRITALRAPAGPGVEFLQYLAPADGRAAEGDRRASDLAAVTTVLVSDDVAADAATLLESGYAWVSPGAVALRDRSLGYAKMATVRDPDGHLLRLVQKEGTP